MTSTALIGLFGFAFALAACGQEKEPIATSICELVTSGEAANDRTVVLRAVANGPMLSDPACPRETITFRFTEHAQTTEQVSSFGRESDRLMLEPPYKSVRINAVGRFASRTEFGAMLVVTDLRSFDLVDNDLQKACSYTGRSDAFCACLQQTLGRQVSADAMDALEAVALDTLQTRRNSPDPARMAEAFHAAISDTRYASPAIGAAFRQCSVGRAW